MNDPDGASLGRNNAIDVEKSRRCRVCSHEKCGLCYAFMVLRTRVNFSNGEFRLSLVPEENKTSDDECDPSKKRKISQDKPTGVFESTASLELNAVPSQWPRDWSNDVLTSRKMNKAKEESQNRERMNAPGNLPTIVNQWDAASWGDVDYTVYPRQKPMNVEMDPRMDISRTTWHPKSLEDRSHLG